MSFPASAKDTVKAITRWCEDQGVAHEYMHLRGGHLAVLLKRDGKSRRVVFSSTPGDKRVIENILQNVRKEARVLGWAPKSKEEKMGVIGGTYGHKPQSAVSTGPAGPATIKKASDLEYVLYAPMAPKAFWGKRFGPSTSNKELRNALAARNKWVVARNAAGVPHEKILKAINDAGWVVSNVNSIRTIIAREAEPKAQPAPDAKPKAEANPDAWRDRLAAVEEKRGLVPMQPGKLSSQLAIAIEQAIMPIIEAHLASQTALLKDKADKWDAISGLVREA